MANDLTSDEKVEYKQALQLFNDKYFWECHEVLEDIWMTKQAPLKTFLQGLIQAAATFYHVLNENPKGVLKLSQDAQNKLVQFGESYLEIDVSALMKSLTEFGQEAQDILNGKRFHFSLDQIPLLRIPESM